VPEGSSITAAGVATCVLDGKGVDIFVIQEEQCSRSVDDVRKMNSEKGDGIKEMIKLE
jgi:hypothetical protein